MSRLDETNSWIDERALYIAIRAHVMWKQPYAWGQRVAVCCSVLQCVAVCRSVFLERIKEQLRPRLSGVCCSVLQRGAGWCSMVQRVAACCSVLQRVESVFLRRIKEQLHPRLSGVCSSVLQCVAVCYGFLQFATACCTHCMSPRSSLTSCSRWKFSKFSSLLKSPY